MSAKEDPVDDDVADGLLADVRDADMFSLLTQPDTNTALDRLLMAEADGYNSFSSNI